MSESIEIALPDQAATEALGAQLAALEQRSGLIFLHGQLGAGKTTLVRGYLQALGHLGAVKSPTYTLIEPYTVRGQHLYHLDIYRLGGVEELDDLGIRDLLDGDSTLLVEWPERAEGHLGLPDLEVTLVYEGATRRASLHSRHPHWCDALAQVISSSTTTDKTGR